MAAVRLRRRSDVDHQMPELLENVARFVRGGSSLPVALRDASAELDESLRRELAVVLSAADHGQSLADSFDEWARASSAPTRHMVAAAMVIAHRVGGRAAHTFDALASSLRARASARRDAHVMAAQAHASALIIGVAPLAFAIVIAAVDPVTAAAAVRSTAGRLCLLAGAGCEALGLWWIHRLSGRAA
jgi:tight adherence protein B